MNEFMILLGQILIITCVQTIVELFVDADKRPYQAKLINIACFAGCLYILIQFIFDFLIAELIQVINFSF